MKKIVFILFVASITTVVAQEKKKLSLEDAVLKQYSEFAPQSLKDVKWIANTSSISYQSDDMQVLKTQSVNDKSAKDLITLVELNKLLNIELKHFYGLKWVDSESFIINNEHDYYLFNSTNKTGSKIATLPEGSENIDVHLTSNKIAYTSGKSLFVYDGKPFSVVNREHEEIVAGQSVSRSEFGITKGTFWSDKGNFLAFYEKDETNVSNYPLLDISTTPANLNSIKYPMAGQESEMVKVGVYNVKDKRTIYLQVEGEKDQYLTNLAWSPDEKYIFIAVVNRAQNHMKLNQYDANSGKFVQTLFEEKNDKWVEPENPPYFISNKEFIWMSERDGFMNLYHYNTNGKLLNQLTKNKWVTTSILGLNKAKELFFTGTGKNPTEHHAFKVSLSNGKQTQLTTEPGWHSVAFNDAGLIDQFSNINTPKVTQILNHQGKNSNVLITAENPLKDYKIGTAEIFTIKAADNETDLYCRMIKPSNFDPEKKYPVLVYVYGGPHAQLVTNRWLASAPLWMYYQAERDYLVFTVDNRGSANRGFAFESIIHRSLGDNEIEDQMQGLNYLRKLPYVQPNRLAVHGWSYGGFMTASLMLRKPNAFKVGVAGGPVTDWKYYEVMYGERYMDTPEENPKGYSKSRLHSYTKNLKGKLLLIHGTVDDVVVMQHNLSLVQSFIDDGVQVDFFPYPMHPHNVRGKDRLHLMQKVLSYIEVNNGESRFGLPNRGPRQNMENRNNEEFREEMRKRREERQKQMKEQQNKK